MLNDWLYGNDIPAVTNLSLLGLNDSEFNFNQIHYEKSPIVFYIGNIKPNAS